MLPGAPCSSMRGTERREKNDSSRRRRPESVTEIFNNLQRCKVSSKVGGHRRIFCLTGEITSELQLPEFKEFKAFANILASQVVELPSPGSGGAWKNTEVDVSF